MVTKENNRLQKRTQFGKTACVLHFLYFRSSLMSWLWSSRRFARVAVTCRRARLTWFTARIAFRLTWLAWFTARLTWLTRFAWLLCRSCNRCREQTWESCADCVLLQRRIYVAGSQNTQLYRYYNFLFAGQTDGDNEISGNLSVAVHIQVSAAVVGRKACFAGRVAELCKARQECGIDRRRHADFKEIGQHHRLALGSDAYLSADSKAAFIVAAVAKE